MFNLTEKEIMKNWPIQNTNNPMVSVRCITYNHEEFIANALESFLMQKTNFPFEIIVHDDASIDNTANIVRQYVKKYPSIIKPIFQTENQHSKNIDIIDKMINAKISGKYVALCEGDDYWCESNKLQRQTDFMENHPECSMCLHNTVFHYVDNSHADRNFNDWNEIHKMTPNEIFFGWNVHTSSYFVKRELDYKPNFSRSVWCGDYVYLTMAMYYGSIYVLPEVMSVYNANISTGVTAQNVQNGIEHMVKRCRDRVNYLKEYNAYTGGMFDEFVQARISETIIEISDEYKELKEAAKKMRNKNYFLIVNRNKCFVEKLKTQWKYRGYIFGYIWYYTILLWHCRIRKRYNIT
jgi:Glycosyltransferases involved in cell wall biogenesis